MTDKKLPRLDLLRQAYRQGQMNDVLAVKLSSFSAKETPESLSLVALAHVEQGREDAALALIDKKTRKDSPWLAIARIDALRFSKREEDALKIGDAFLEKPGIDPLMRALIQVRVAATLLHLKRDFDRCDQLLREASEVLNGANDPFYIAECVFQRGRWFHNQNRHDEAVTAYRDALARFEEIGSGFMAGRCLGNLVYVASETDRIDALTLEYAREAFACFQGSGARDKQFETLCLAVGAARHREDNLCLSERLERFARQEYPEGIVQALLIRAESLGRAGFAFAADQLWAELERDHYETLPDDNRVILHAIRSIADSVRGDEVNALRHHRTATQIRDNAKIQHAFELRRAGEFLNYLKFGGARFAQEALAFASLDPQKIATSAEDEVILERQTLSKKTAAALLGAESTSSTTAMGEAVFWKLASIFSDAAEHGAQMYHVRRPRAGDLTNLSARFNVQLFWARLMQPESTPELAAKNRRAINELVQRPIFEWQLRYSLSRIRRHFPDLADEDRLRKEVGSMIVSGYQLERIAWESLNGQAPVDRLEQVAGLNEQLRSLNAEVEAGSPRMPEEMRKLASFIKRVLDGEVGDEELAEMEEALYEVLRKTTPPETEQLSERVLLFRAAAMRALEVIERRHRNRHRFMYYPPLPHVWVAPAAPGEKPREGALTCTYGTSMYNFHYEYPVEGFGFAKDKIYVVTCDGIRVPIFDYCRIHNITAYCNRCGSDITYEVSMDCPARR